MSKTWYGHHIETIKGEDYVLHKDYTELQNKLEKENKRLNNIINGLEKHLKNEISSGRSEDNVYLMGCYDEDREILDKLQELKGDGSNGN